jgi:Ca2+/Na+ antiporter
VVERQPEEEARDLETSDAPSRAAAGLVGSPPEADEELRRSGLDAHRLSAFRLGRPPKLLWRGRPPWFRRLAVGGSLWASAMIAEWADVATPLLVELWGALLIGLIILQAACDALITATERLAARKQWDHYVAGTLAEIFSTLPEFVVIAFVIPVSPVAAVVIALATIYNNALVFSLYSYFLPKDKKGLFLMPVAITEAGTQLLIAGAAIGSTLGLVMLILTAHDTHKDHFAATDLIVLAVIMLSIFATYAYKLVHGYAKEESLVHEALRLEEPEIARRKELIYENVRQVSPWNIAALFFIGIVSAFLGGERVSVFAETAIRDLGLNEVAAAVILAGFAGMSEYVILWRAHRTGQHRIALANAFGGITQVMFLVLPFTLFAVGVYQGLISPDHLELPLHFNVSITLLTALLFPTFYVLVALLEEDHTFGILDTVIMCAICSLVLLSLLAYGT